MIRTLRGKLLSRIIIAVVVINIIFTIFITLFLESTLKNNITEEMTRAKEFSVNTIEQDKIIEESVWKTLNKIKALTNSYVAVANNENKITEAVSSILNEEEVSNILFESNNSKSIIKFKKLKDIYCITYNYPVYLENKLYCNLVIQKNYSEKYDDMIKTIMIILLGQAIVVLIILVIIYIIINRVTMPINILSNSMKNFTESIEEEDVIVNSNDEVGELASTYNLMKNRLKNQMDEIVSEKDKVERLQKSSREFFNNATHELKTPVTAISLYSQILKENDIRELDNDFIYRATDRLVLESEKMKALVEKILDVSRGTVNINKAKVAFLLSDLIYEIIDDFEVRLSNNKLQINKEIESIRYYGVLEDIEQIIVNLIDNSIKYSIGKDINIKLHEIKENIILEISNECTDFPKDIKENLLEPFVKYNIYEDISKEVSSSGLGLYLCREIAKENQGELTYRIEENNIAFKLILSNNYKI